MLKIRNKHDYRILIVILIAITISIITWSYIRTGSYHKPLKTFFGIQANDLSFLDLRLVIWDIHKMHQNIVTHPDTYSPINQAICSYPSTWYVFYYLGISENQVNIIGFIFILLFYSFTLYFLGKTNFLTSIYFGIILCSTPVILALERGNVDIFLYLIILTAILFLNRNTLQRISGYILIAVATLLKLYPVFAFALALREKKAILLKLIFLVSSLLFIIFLSGLINPQKLLANTLKPVDISSFGAQLMPDFIHIYVLPSLSTDFMMYGVRFFIGIILFWGYLQTRRNDNQTEPGIKLDSFRIGAAIYLGCFILSYNFLYRMIFVILALPQIITWCSQANIWGKFSRFILIIIILSFTYLIIFQHIIPSGYLFVFKEMLFWILFVYFSMTFMQTLPDWLRFPNVLAIGRSKFTRS